MDDASSRKVDVGYSSNVDLSDASSNRRFSSWEEQCILDTEVESSSETYLEEQRNLDQKLWLVFQNTASAIAQLYKDRAQGRDDLWTSFQNAAEIATNMYKESVDGYRRVSDLAMQCGYQRRNKEMLSWIKKRRKHIRREDLLGYLCGRSPPHRMGRPTTSISRSPSLATSPGPSSNQLQTFQDAVLMNGLNGAMADISFGGDAALRRNNSPARSCQQSFHPDLTDFITEEIKRRNESVSLPSCSRKRHNSLHDVKPSSPKRRK